MNLIGNSGYLARSVAACIIAWACLAHSAVIGQQESTVALLSGELRVGVLHTQSHWCSESFQIDDCDEISLILTSPDNGLRTSITTPGGLVITPSTVGSLGGSYVMVQGSASGGSFITPIQYEGFNYIYTIPSQGAGTYIASASLDFVVDQVPVLFRLSTDSPIRVALFCSRPVFVNTAYWPESRTVITAAVFAGSEPVTNATVTLHVNGHGWMVPETVMPLLDDGGVGDAVSDDGLYGGVFSSDFAFPWRFYAVADISGTHAGVPFVRKAAVGFELLPGRASLFSAPVFGLQDSNGDGLAERLHFPVTRIGMSGECLVMARFKTPSGQVVYGRGHGTGPAGSQSIDVSIDAKEITRVGENGPYSLEAVELFSVRPGYGKVLEMSKAYDPPLQTPAFQVGDFDRPPFVYSGIISESAFSNDQDSDFDVLRVVLGLSARRAGNYSFAARLADGCFRTVARVAGTVGLNGTQPALLTLDFNGTAIGAHGIAGPFKLRDFVIHNIDEGQREESFMLIDAGQTDAYPVAQFDGYTGAGGDCNGNGQPDDCECLGDINGDHVVNLTDQSIFLTAFGACTGQAGFDVRADFNSNGCVDLSDLACFIGRFGSGC